VESRNRTPWGPRVLIALALFGGVGGCKGSGSEPAAPTTAAPAAPPSAPVAPAPAPSSPAAASAAPAPIPAAPAPTAAASLAALEEELTDEALLKAARPKEEAGGPRLEPRVFYPPATVEVAEKNFEAAKGLIQAKREADAGAK
jgi:hypothetical protein